MPDIDRTLETDLEEYSRDPEFIAEGLAIKVTEEMLELLEQKGQNQSWLAQSMRVSRAHISRILNAPPNMTFLTLARIAVALGVTPDVELNAKPESRQTVATGPSGYNYEEALLSAVSSILHSGTADAYLPPSERQTRQSQKGGYNLNEAA